MGKKVFQIHKWNKILKNSFKKQIHFKYHFSFEICILNFYHVFCIIQYLASYANNFPYCYHILSRIIYKKKVSNSSVESDRLLFPRPSGQLLNVPSPDVITWALAQSFNSFDLDALTISVPRSLYTQKLQQTAIRQTVVVARSH